MPADGGGGLCAAAVEIAPESAGTNLIGASLKVGGSGGVSIFGLRFAKNWFTLRSRQMSSLPPTRIINSEKPPSVQMFALSARVASGAAVLCFAWVLWQTVARTPLPGKPGWAEALLVVTTALATLLALARQLPGAKVILAAAIVGLTGGLVHAIGVTTAIPFGPFVYSERIGPKLFGAVAWPLPALWIIIVLNARGVARMILKPWRKLKHYGFWVIGVATALVVLLNLALEPFATRGSHYWLWLPTKFPITWHGMPLTNSLGWALGSLLMFAFATPFLVNTSSRSRKLPPDYHPLVVWLLLLTLFGTGAAMEQFWSATILCVITGIVTTIFAVRGARW